MKVIDIETWKRKIPYENFIGYTNPVFSISSKIDVTELVERCKSKGESFFANFVYILLKSINEIEDLKIRIKDNKVVYFDKINPGYIVMQDNGVIATCRTEYDNDYTQFYKSIRKDIERVKKGDTKKEFNSSPLNDCVYISCLPWVEIVSVINPYDLNDKEQSSIPRITWGKFVKEDNGRYKMGFDIACHHALTDGQPLAMLINKINDYIKITDKILK